MRSNARLRLKMMLLVARGGPIQCALCKEWDLHNLTFGHVADDAVQHVKELRELAGYSLNEEKYEGNRGRKGLGANLPQLMKKLGFQIGRAHV